MDKNIHPVFDKIMQRPEKESLLKQHSKVIWLTGFSGAGKSTIAAGIEHELAKRGYLTKILDGDNIRTGINQNLGFSIEDRAENIRRIAEVSKLFIDCGIITINSFVSPTIEIREEAKKIIGEKDFIEVFINASLDICEKRDTKGLYKKARKGEIKNFTGIDSPFEKPMHPDVDLKTGELTIHETINQLLEYILPIVKY